MSLKFHFILDNHDFSVQVSLDLANKIGKKVSDEAFKNGKYIVQSNASKENFQSFLDILINDIKNPTINENNYYDYYLLNEEFNDILKDHISKYDDLHNISFIYKAISNATTDKSHCEEYISAHLDDFLEKYKDDMAKIQYTSLYNIFQHKKRNLQNQERAYQFIKYVLSKSENESPNNKANICILFETLEGKYLSEESLEESLLKRQERFGFAPKIDYSINKNIKELKIQLENKYETSFNELIQKQQEIMNEMKQQQQQAMDEIKQQNLLLINIIKEQQQSISEMKQQQTQLLNENNQQKQAINDMKSYFEQKINLIQANCESLSQNSNEAKTELNSISELIKNNELKISSMKEQILKDVQQNSAKNDDVQKQINVLAEKFNEIKSANDQIAQKCSDSYSCVQDLPNKVNSIINDNKQILDKSSGILSISLASIGSFKGIIRQLTDECGGNVSDKNVVNVTSSSVLDRSHLPKIAVDLDDGNSFISKDEPNSWLKYDFKNRRIRPICYLIKSGNYSKGDDHPKNWVIEGSNSDSSSDWISLDTRNNVSSLDNNYAVQVFSIQKSNVFYKYLRIRQTGKNSHDKNLLQLSVLEFFGSIQ